MGAVSQSAVLQSTVLQSPYNSIAPCASVVPAAALLFFAEAQAWSG